MERPVQLSPSELLSVVSQRGPVSATELAATLRVNRTTIIRGIQALGRRIVVFGATRSTRYSVRRPLRNAGDRWPIYRIRDTGQAEPWAEVEFSSVPSSPLRRCRWTKPRGMRRLGGLAIFGNGWRNIPLFHRLSK